jgi:hypothetical protein
MSCLFSSTNLAYFSFLLLLISALSLLTAQPLRQHEQLHCYEAHHLAACKAALPQLGAQHCQQCHITFSTDQASHNHYNSVHRNPLPSSVKTKRLTHPYLNGKLNLYPVTPTSNMFKQVSRATLLVFFSLTDPHRQS